MIGRLWLAFLASLLLIGPAHADPVTGAILAYQAWYATIGVVGQFVVSAAVSAALSAASMGLAYLVSGAGQTQAAGESSDTSVSVTEIDGLLEVRRVYGTVVVNGAMFFSQTVEGAGSTTPNRWIMGLALSEGTCEGVVSLIINETECLLDANGYPTTAPWYDSSGVAHFKASFRSGTDSQAIDPIISSYWASPPADFYPDASDRVTRWAQFRQRGVATLVLDLSYGTNADHHIELWGAGGIPTIAVKLRGLQVLNRLDPTQAANDASTWAWTDLASAVIEDYLVSGIGGQVARADVDASASLESLALDADYVTTLDGVEQRGRINGEVLSRESPLDVLNAMNAQTRGQLTRADGLYRIRSDRAAAAVATIHRGQWRDQITMVNEADIRSQVSGVVAQFYPASRYNESAETSYPAAALDDDTASRQTLRFCDSPAQAQRLAFARYTEAQIGRTISGTFDISVLFAPGKANRMLEIGDVVYWQGGAPYDDMDGLYRVDAAPEISADFSVSLSLSGTSADIIDGWSVALETAFVDAA